MRRRERRQAPGRRRGHRRSRWSRWRLRKRFCSFLLSRRRRWPGWTRCMRPGRRPGRRSARILWAGLSISGRIWKVRNRSGTCFLSQRGILWIGSAWSRFWAWTRKAGRWQGSAAARSLGKRLFLIWARSARAGIRRRLTGSEP